MFKHILVPLDGSRLAETALPTAAHLSRMFNAEIVLVHVIEHNAPQKIHGDRHLTNEGEACGYLLQAAESYFSPGMIVQRHVHTEEIQNVARGILSHVDEFGSDLIVMCAHGNGGLHDWMAGNIAQQIISQGSTPVILLRPTETPPAPVNFSHILVALDGISEHETGLSLVATLALAAKADLRLIQVVPTLNTLSGEKAASGRLMPAATATLLDMAEIEAAEHLLEHAAEWQKLGLQVDTEICRGDPATQVLAAIRNAGLLVLGTHGKAGIQAFWAGSVASKIVAQSQLPLLLIPVRV